MRLSESKVLYEIECTLLLYTQHINDRNIITEFISDIKRIRLTSESVKIDREMSNIRIKAKKSTRGRPSKGRQIGRKLAKKGRKSLIKNTENETRE